MAMSRGRQPGPAGLLVDEAATLCSMIASNERLWDFTPPVSESIASLGAADIAYRLARKANARAIDRLVETVGFSYSIRDAWALAEAMLRTREVRP